MKKTQQCPKCNSADLIKIPGNYALSVHASNMIQMGFRRVDITRFVCSECGYSEEWIEEKADLQRLKNRFG